LLKAKELRLLEFFVRLFFLGLRSGTVFCIFESARQWCDHVFPEQSAGKILINKPALLERRSKPGASQ
jgi:hypothetical protein